MLAGEVGESEAKNQRHVEVAMLATEVEESEGEEAACPEPKAENKTRVDLYNNGTGLKVPPSIFAKIQA